MWASPLNSLLHIPEWNLIASLRCCSAQKSSVRPAFLRGERLWQSSSWAFDVAAVHVKAVWRWRPRNNWAIHPAGLLNALRCFWMHQRCLYVVKCHSATLWMRWPEVKQQAPYAGSEGVIPRAVTNMAVKRRHKQTTMVQTYKNAHFLPELSRIYWKMGN